MHVQSVIAGDNKDLLSYRVVRLTISNLGHLRLQATVSGITLSTAFLGVGYAAWHYVPKMKLLGRSFDLGAPLAFVACAISMMLAIQFLRKIRLYTNYLDESLDIACMLERNLIDDPSYRLTERFHAEIASGSSATLLFVTSVYALIAMAFIGVLLGIAEFVYSFGIDR
jgi:hypothetical protein